MHERTSLTLSAFCVALLLCSGHAAAAVYDGLDLSVLVGMRPLDGVPVGGIFADERINMYVGGEPAGSIVLSNGTITQAGTTILDDPTMNVRASEETANAIATGQKTLGQCFLDGDISYEGVGFFNVLKAFFAGIGAWIYSLFS